MTGGHVNTSVSIEGDFEYCSSRKSPSAQILVNRFAGAAVSDGVPGAGSIVR